jgi:hypothetical protein
MSGATYLFFKILRSTVNMTVEDPSSLVSYADALLDRSGSTPLAVRFRALFALKALASEGNNNAVDIIADGSPIPE